jgi:hypothetical protein
VSRTVVLTASAQRDLRRLDRPVATRILDALTRLPIPAKAMSPGYGAPLMSGGSARATGASASAMTTPRTLEVLRILPRGQAYR